MDSNFVQWVLTPEHKNRYEMSGICLLTAMEECYKQRERCLGYQLSGLDTIIAQNYWHKESTCLSQQRTSQPLFSAVILPGKKTEAEHHCHQICWHSTASLEMLATAEISAHIPDSVFKEGNLSLVLVFSIMLCRL